MALAAFIISVLLILVASAIVIMQKQGKRIHDKNTYIIYLEETLTDALDGNIEKAWELQREGIETVLQRGRPDLEPRRQATMPPGQPRLINLTNVKEDNVKENEQ